MLNYTITIILDVTEKTLNESLRSAAEKPNPRTIQQLKYERTGRFNSDTDVVRKYQEIVEAATKACAT